MEYYQVGEGHSWPWPVEYCKVTEGIIGVGFSKCVTLTSALQSNMKLHNIVRVPG